MSGPEWLRSARSSVDGQLQQNHLLDLRQLVSASGSGSATSADMEVPATVLRACVEARAAYEASLSELRAGVTDHDTDAAATVILFRRVWEQFSTLPVHHPLFTPPIYSGNAVLAHLLFELARAVRVRELNPDESFPHGHAVVDGVEGTGKSTVVKAIAVAVAACSASYLLLYLDCSTLPATAICMERIRKELLVRLRLRKYDGIFGKLAETNRAAADLISAVDAGSLSTTLRADAGVRVGLIVDEFQLLIIPHAPHDGVHVASVRDIAAFARFTPAALLVITGSSFDLRKKLYGAMRAPEYSNYSDFNKSLCEYYHVAALRSRRELAAYLTLRYPKRPFTDDGVAIMLHETGGIGRLIHSLVVNGRILLPRRADPASALADVVSPFVVLLSHVRVEHAAALDDAIINWRAGRAHALQPADVSIPIADAIAVLQRAGCSQPDHFIHEKVDNGLLYIDNVASARYVQLARPSDAKVYYLWDTIRPTDYQRLSCVYLMVHKPEVSVNAGTALEELLRPRIHALLPGVAAWDATQCILIGEHGKLYLRRASEPPRLLSLDDTSWQNRVLKWHGETGLDSVVMQMLEGALVLTGWQCKGGALRARFGGGDPDTYRTKITAKLAARRARITSRHVAAGDVSDGDEDESATADGTGKRDQYVAQVLATAEWGFTKLLAAADATFSDLPLRLGQLLLTTTKGDSALAQRVLTASHGAFVIPAGLLRAYAVRDHGVTYNVSLRSGDDWLRECLEPQLQAMWPAASVSAAAAR